MLAAFVLLAPLKRRHLTAAAFQRCIIEALDKSKEQEALQYLVGRAQTRMNRLRQQVGENLLKLAAATIAITTGAALLIAYKPEIRDALHKARSPTLYSIYRNIGEAQSMAKLLTNLADRCLRRGAYELAQAQAEKAIEIFTNLHGKDTSLLLVPLNVQAAAQERTGDLVSANKTALRALDLAAKTSDSHLDAQAKSNLNLAHLAQSQGDWQKAGSYFRNAIDLAEKGDLHLDNAASLKESLSEYAAYLRREQRIPESEQIDQNLKAVEAKWPDKAPVSDRTAR